jgi:hypothetical protein
MQGFAASVGARVQEAQEQWKQQHDTAWERYQADLTAWQTRMNIVERQAERIYQSDTLTDDQKAAAVQQLMDAVGPMPQPPQLPPFPTVRNWVEQNIFHRTPAAPQPPAPPAPAQPAPAQPAAAPGGAGAWRPWKAPSPVAAAPQPAAPAAPQPAAPATAQPAQPGIGKVVVGPSGIPTWVPPKSSAMTVQQAHDQYVGKDPQKEEAWKREFGPYIQSPEEPLSAVFHRMQRAGVSNPGDILARIRAGWTVVTVGGQQIAIPNDPVTGKPDPETVARYMQLNDEQKKELRDRYETNVAAVLADDSLTPQQRQARLASLRQAFAKAMGVPVNAVGDEWTEVTANAQLRAAQIRQAAPMPVEDPLTGKPLTRKDAQGRDVPILLPAAQALQINLEGKRFRAERADRERDFNERVREHNDTMAMERERLSMMKDERAQSIMNRALERVDSALRAYWKADDAVDTAEGTWLAYIDPATGTARPGLEQQAEYYHRQLVRAVAQKNAAWKTYHTLLRQYNEMARQMGEPGLPDEAPVMKGGGPPATHYAPNPPFKTTQSRR